MSTDQQPISDDEIRDVMGWLNEALSTAGAEARHEQVGRAVRTLTRLWADQNPDFDGDAWYPVSAMLTEHWAQINGHMSAVDLQPASEPAADQELDGHHSASPDRGGNVHRASDGHRRLNTHCHLTARQSRSPCQVLDRRIRSQASVATEISQRASVSVPREERTQYESTPFRRAWRHRCGLRM